MIFILTNNRVIERVKEIGIIKSLGARDRDITRLFNIENFIIGIISSLMGIVVMLGLKRGINYLFFIVLKPLIFVFLLVWFASPTKELNFCYQDQYIQSIVQFNLFIY